jgi:drug/metabolite transporter (DMT)-like permease
LKGDLNKSSKFVVLGVLVLIQVLFGINFGTSKVVLTSLDPFVWSNLRFFIAGIVMLSLTLLLKRPHPKFNKEFFLPMIPLSLLGMSLGQGLFLFGLKMTSSVNTAIITSTIPLITMIVVILRKQEHLTLNKGIGFFISFLGVIFIKDLSGMAFTFNTIAGDILVFSGAVCFALYLSFGKKFLMSFDNMWVTSYMFLISSVMMFILNILRGSEFNISQDFSHDFIICATYTIIGATLITYFLNNWALKRAASGNVALFIYLQPIVAGIIGYFFLGETITIRMILCSLLIVIGVVISLKSKSKVQ